MWINKSYTAKLLVWLAAALMPANVLLAGSCGCAVAVAGDVQVKAVNTHQATACCCHSSAVCQCSHQAKKVKQSDCCKNSVERLNSTREKVFTSCTCPGSKIPLPQNTLPDSSAKQLIGNADACLASTAVAALPSDGLHSIDHCPYIPATSLERLSNLCRLII